MISKRHQYRYALVYVSVTSKNRKLTPKQRAEVFNSKAMEPDSHGICRQYNQ